MTGAGIASIEFFEFLFQNYLLTSLLIILITVAIFVVVYLLGKLAAQPDWCDWALYEGYQAFGSLAILIFVGLALKLAGNVMEITLKDSGLIYDCDADTCNYTKYEFEADLNRFGNVKQSIASCNKMECHIEVAKALLNASYSLSAHFIANAITTAGGVTLLTELTIVKTGVLHAFPIPEAFAPFAGLGMIDQLYENLTATFSIVLGMLKGNEFILQITQSALFAYFLMAGIALRSISLLRRVGGLLIALSITLYFIHPGLVILESALLMPDPRTFPLNFEQFEGSLSIIGDAATGANLLNFLGFRKYEIEINGKKIEVDAITYAVFAPILPGHFAENIAMLTVWILAQQIILIYAIVITVKELSPLFGGDVELAGIGRLL